MKVFKIILGALYLFTCLGYGAENQAQPVDTLKIKAEVDSLVALGETYIYETYQLDEALEILTSTLETSQAIGYGTKESESYNLIGSVYNMWGDYDKALQYYEKGLDKCREIGHKGREAVALYNIGLIHNICQRIQQATNYYRQCLDLSREIGYRPGEAIALSGLTDMARQRSDYMTALEYGEKSLKIFRELEDPQGEVDVLNILGTVYFAMNDISTSEECVARSLQIATEIHSVYSEVSNMQAMAALCIERKDYDKALEWCQKSIEKNKEMNNRETEGWSLWAMGDIYYFKMDYPAALEYYSQTLDISREFGIDNLEGYVLKSIGLTYGNIGDFLQAIENTRQGISKFQALGDMYSLGLSYYDLALWYSEQANDSLAIENYTNAIDVIEMIRGSLDTEAFRTGYAEKSIDAYVGMIGCLLRLNEEINAFDYMERSRARSFLDLMGSGDVTVGKSHHAEFLQKEEEYYEHEDEIEQQIAAVADDTVQVAILRGKLEEEWESIDALIEEKKMYEPELASMITVNPLTLPEVQELIDPKSTILEYFLTDEKTLIWLITRDNMEVFQVEVGGDSIETLVKDFRDAILTEGLVEDRSQALYEILIAPAEDRIETRQLVIIPHGILHYLPFPALQDKKGKYLLDIYEISYLPSASVLKYLESKKRPKGETLLAFGNPTTDREGYDPIPFAEGEVNAIADFYEEPLLYTREDATEDRFRELAPDYDVIHLACHSELNSAYPLFSGLLLAPGEEQDGELDVHELFTMDLNAYLVVLSACQTGLGHLTNGDELVGLSRAFIYAGTPSVVSSLWVVKDESTAYLMTELHKNLQKYNKAEALRRAQLNTKKKYKSPYHWASFVLIGSPN